MVPDMGVRLKGATIAVTGGAGFIGSHLVQHLIQEGVSRIVVIDDLRSGDVANIGTSAKVELARFSLGRDDPNMLDSLLRGVDGVFHLAAEKHNQTAVPSPEYFRSNIDGSFALLDAAARCGVRKVVYASSLYVYGRMQPPALDEAEIPQPVTIYGLSKLCAEHLLSHFRTYRALPGNTVRYFFVYGPRQYAGMGYRSVIVKTFERLLAGQAPVIHGDGEQVFDYVYVDDAVRATVNAMVHPADGLCVNVGSGAGISINRLMALMQEVAGTSFEPEHLAPDSTARSSRVARVEQARKSLGWTVEIDITEGLCRTFAWMIGHRASARVPTE